MEPEPQEERLLRKHEAAELLGISERTFDRIRERGDIEDVPLGKAVIRWRLSDVQRLMQPKQVTA